MRFLFTLLFLLSVFQIHAQDKPSYADWWLRVYEYEIGDLPASAREVADSIYQYAASEGNALQQIRSLIYLAKFRNILEEDPELAIMADFRKELIASEGIKKAVMASMMGTLYNEYYSRNYWNITNRTSTEGGSDFRTWSSDQFEQQIDSLFRLSLRDTLLLKQTQLDDVEEILFSRQANRHVRPTLYDLLAHEALNYYENPREKNKIVLPARIFTSPDITTAQADYHQRTVLDLYASLMRFHSSDTAAIVNLWIERTQYLSSIARSENLHEIKDPLYDSLFRQYRDHEAGTLLLFERANELYNRGNAYSPDAPDLKYAWRDALSIARQAIDLFPDSHGANKSRVLADRITGRSVWSEMELFIPADQYSPLRVEFRNTDSIRISIRKIPFGKTIHDQGELEKYLKGFDEVYASAIALPYADDYRKHSTEIALPPLPLGKYGILVSADTIYSSPATFQVTNLVLDVVSTGPDVRINVLDRITGMPVDKAGIRVEFPELPRKPEVRKGSGQFIISPGPYEVWATYGPDTIYLPFQQYYYNRKLPKSSDHTARIMAFTDRSIYRPGQALYFKAILVQQKMGETSVVPGEYINVYLEDPNGEEIVDLRLKTNEFGSVSGQIELPSDRITGEYWLYADEDYEEGSSFYDEELDDLEWAEIMIRVEEYKRPTFEVTFDAVTESFAIGDSITVTGKAMSFAGAPISNALTDVTVEMSSRNLYSYNYYGYDRETVLVEETRTDAEGRFSVTFRSKPSWNPDHAYPIQHYEVTADIHDITGEVRTGEIEVKAAQHALTVGVRIPPEIAQGDTIHAAITSKTINNAPEEAAGRIELIRLEPPARPLKARNWETPDMPLYDRKTFRKLFPNRVYSEEMKRENWKRGGVVETYNFRGTGKWDVTLTNKLPGGHYLVKTYVDTVYHAAPVEEAYFWVKPSYKALPDHKTFTLRTPDIFFPGEPFYVEMASGIDSLFVNIILVHDKKIIATRDVLLLAGKGRESFKTEKGFNEPLEVYFSYVWQNSFETGSKQINPRKTPGDLGIEVLTFRDKIDPGAQEEWRFKITGSNGKKAAAEVLASMYDASLDKFTEHEWSLPVIEPPRYYYDDFSRSISRNFMSANLYNVIRYHNGYRSMPTRQFDALNWFGFNLIGQSYTNKRYLSRLKLFLPMVDTVSQVSRAFDPEMQKGYISGYVVSKDNEPLPGVNVLVKGTTRGTTTDMSGYYSIRAASKDELIFSFVGYSTVSVSPGATNAINITMAEDISFLSEIVVMGYGVEQKSELTGAVAVMEDSEVLFAYESGADLDVKLNGRVAGVQIRGINSVLPNDILVVVDGVIQEAGGPLPNEVATVQVLKDEAATAIYGARAANGVVIITTEAGQKRLDEQLAAVQSRADHRETAFFLPHLSTNRKGEVSFSFTSPESLTRWKLQLLAHDRSFRNKITTLQTVTQKDIMVVPNLPRFMREGDEVKLTAKVVNLSNEGLTGQAVLILTDPFTGTSLDSLTETDSRVVFTVAAGSQETISWKISVPEGLSALEVDIRGVAGNQGDGERHILPVLPNRTLVTQSIPLYSKQGQENVFVLDDLKNTSSTTLANQSLRLSVDTDPVWTALQALPYLMEFPYECSEQTFARLFANRLGAYLLNGNPSLAMRLRQAKKSSSIQSPLEKNQAVMSVMLQETPWLRDAKNSSESIRQMADLMQADSLAQNTMDLLEKLIDMQRADGGMPWFAGGRSNRFITQHIATGLVRLIDLTGDEDFTESVYPSLLRMKDYLDQELQKDYENGDVLRHTHYQYFYFNGLQLHDSALSEDTTGAYRYYYNEMKNSWQAEDLMLKSMAALAFYYHGDTSLAGAVLQSIREYSLKDEEMGMYWKPADAVWYWNQAPIESHVMAMHAFDVILSDSLAGKQQMLEDQKVWLLRQKQSQHWPSTKATTEAVHALLSLGADWVGNDPQITINAGDGGAIQSAGDGRYFKHWKAGEIWPELATVRIEQKGTGASWGSLQWKYFEDYDKISNSGEALRIEKQVFKVNTSTDGESMVPVTSGSTLKQGDLVRIRLVLHTDRALEFIHLKDQRGAGFEPVDVLSGYRSQEGLHYYQSTRDAATHFFFDRAERGIYVFEYDLRATLGGTYSFGIAQMENMYSPAFSANSGSFRIIIE